MASIISTSEAERCVGRVALAVGCLHTSAFPTTGSRDAYWKVGLSDGATDLTAMIFAKPTVAFAEAVLGSLGDVAVVRGQLQLHDGRPQVSCPSSTGRWCVIPRHVFRGHVSEAVIAQLVCWLQDHAAALVAVIPRAVGGTASSAVQALATTAFSVYQAYSQSLRVGTAAAVSALTGREAVHPLRGAYCHLLRVHIAAAASCFSASVEQADDVLVRIVAIQCSDTTFPASGAAATASAGGAGAGAGPGAPAVGAGKASPGPAVSWRLWTWDESLSPYTLGTDSSAGGEVVAVPCVPVDIETGGSMHPAVAATVRRLAAVVNARRASAAAGGSRDDHRAAAAGILGALSGASSGAATGAPAASAGDAREIIDDTLPPGVWVRMRNMVRQQRPFSGYSGSPRLEGQPALQMAPPCGRWRFVAAMPGAGATCRLLFQQKAGRSGLLVVPDEAMRPELQSLHPVVAEPSSSSAAAAAPAAASSSSSGAAVGSAAAGNTDDARAALSTLLPVNPSLASMAVDARYDDDYDDYEDVLGVPVGRGLGATGGAGAASASAAAAGFGASAGERLVIVHPLFSSSSTAAASGSGAATAPLHLVAELDPDAVSRLAEEGLLPSETGRIESIPITRIASVRDALAKAASLRHSSRGGPVASSGAGLAHPEETELASAAATASHAGASNVRYTHEDASASAANSCGMVRLRVVVQDRYPLDETDWMVPTRLLPHLQSEAATAAGASSAPQKSDAVDSAAGGAFDLPTDGADDVDGAATDGASEQWTLSFALSVQDAPVDFAPNALGHDDGSSGGSITSVGIRADAPLPPRRRQRARSGTGGAGADTDATTAAVDAEPTWISVPPQATLLVEGDEALRLLSGSGVKPCDLRTAGGDPVRSALAAFARAIMVPGAVLDILAVPAPQSLPCACSLSRHQDSNAVQHTSSSGSSRASAAVSGDGVVASAAGCQCDRPVLHLVATRLLPAAAAAIAADAALFDG